LDAWSPDDPPPAQGESLNPRPLRGLRGEVTALHESGFSLLTRYEQTVEVNVHSGTKIWLVETLSQGTLDDIQVGDGVLVQGCRCSETSLGAQRIVVGPDGDEVHGRVTAVEGTAIRLENQDGTATVLTGDDTEFRLGREAAALADVTEGAFLVAFGQLQSDGSLKADLAIIRPPPKPPVRTLRGEVTAVSSTGLTVAVPRPRAADQAPVSVQVNVTEETKVWLVESESQGSLADVEVGDQVVVRGTRAEGSTADAPAVQAPAMQALQIAIAPSGDRALGRVAAVEGTTLTLRTREGEVTVRIDADTSFRKGRQPASLEDDTRGAAVVAFGELQADGSLDANQVFIQRAPPRQPGAGIDAAPGGSGGSLDEQSPVGASSAPVPDARHSALQS